MKIRVPWRLTQEEAEPELEPVNGTANLESIPDPVISTQIDLPQELASDVPDVPDKKKPAASRSGRSLLKLRVASLAFRWNQKTVTVSLEKDVIRVVTFKGKRVTGWRTTDISPGNQPDNGDGETVVEDTSAPPLRRSLDEMGIKDGGRVWRLLDKVGFRRSRVLMDLSLYTTLMRHLQIPKVRVRYLEAVVTSEVLESLPFNKDEVDISWQLHKGEEGQWVYAIALPKQRVDSQVQLVKGSGLVPAAAYSKASALALAAGISEGIVVHLETSETALVLVSEGEPKVVHQLEIGNDGASSNEHANTMIRAIEQVAGYYQPTDPEQQGRSLPVILTGQVSEDNPNTKALLSKLRRQVVTIAPPLRYPEEFPLSEYATNLGLLLADRSDNTTLIPESSGASQPLNLLPRRHRPKPVPVFPAAVFIILILLAVHPFNITTQVEAKMSERDVISRQLQSLKGQEKAHDVVLTTYQKNTTQFEDANDEIAKLEAQLGELDADMQLLLARLMTITDTAVPDTVALSTVSPLGSDFSLIGMATSHSETLRYASNLKHNPLFKDARVIRVNGAGGANPDASTVVSFQIRVTVPDAEESEEESTE